MFSVGPFKLEKSENGLQAGLNLNLNTLGGLTLMVPTSQTYEKKSLAWFIASGPIASLLFFIILSAVSYTLHGVYEVQGIANAIIYFSWLTAIITLVIGVFALMPEEEIGLESDGLQIINLLQGGKKAQTKQFVMQLSTASWNGTRPGNLDSSIITHLIELTAEEKGSNAILAKLLAYVHHMDKNSAEEAKLYLDEAVKICEETNNDLLNATVFLEKSFFEVYFNQDVEKASHYFEKGKNGYSEKSTLKRTETALNLLKGDLKSARKNAEDAFKHLENSHDKGGAIWEKEILDELLITYDISPVENKIKRL